MACTHHRFIQALRGTALREPASRLLSAVRLLLQFPLPQQRQVPVEVEEVEDQEAAAVEVEEAVGRLASHALSVSRFVARETDRLGAS